MISVVIIIVAKLNAIAAMAIRTITFVNDLDFENAILLAMKCEIFIHNDSETLPQVYNYNEICFGYLIKHQSMSYGRK